MKEQQIADSLYKARKHHNSISPISTMIGETDLELAYKIQDINTQRRINEGARITGKKIGLTSTVVQKQLGVDQPDYGILFHDMEVLNGASLSMKEMDQPKVEAELAFFLSKDLDKENLTAVDVLDAIAFALPAIEIVGSRVADWKIKITDTIADNASASHYVIGHTQLPLTNFDVVGTQMELFINGNIVSKGTGAACLGSPINATLWLAQKMMSLGNPLRSGELIFSGALGPMAEVSANDQVEVIFDGKYAVNVNFTD